MRLLVKAPALLGLVALCAAPTDCDQFESTTVDTTSAYPPLIINGFYGPGSDEVFNNEGSYRIPNFNTALIAYGAAYKHPGGVHKITVSWQLQLYCSSGGIGVWIEPLDSVPSESQTGAQGDTVSDGIYLMMGFNPSLHACPSGYSPTYVGLSWTTTGENFHGDALHHSYNLYWQR